MLKKEVIFADFRKLKTSDEKVEYLRWLQEQQHNLVIDFDKLIEYWSNKKQ